MALANRATGRLSFGELIAEGSDFAREAWRECWLPMLLVIAGHTLMFLDKHVTAADLRLGIFGWIAPALMIFYVPLYGGLYRAALGHHARSGQGPGGLHWSGVEWRLIGVGVVIAFLVGLAMTPFLAANAVAALILRNGVFSAGPLGLWARWVPVAIVIWAIFFWILGPRLARLMLGWPFSVARGKTEPFAGFGPSRDSGWPLAFALFACFVPLLLGWLAFYAIGLVEADAISGVYWPLPEAIGIGLLLGAIKAGIVAPMIVGVLCGGWWLLEGDHLDEDGKPPVHHGALHGLAEAAVAAAAALAAKESAELGLGHHGDAPAEGGDGHEPVAEADAGELQAPADGDHAVSTEAHGDAGAEDHALGGDAHHEATTAPDALLEHEASPHAGDLAAAEAAAHAEEHGHLDAGAEAMTAEAHAAEAPLVDDHAADAAPQEAAPEHAEPHDVPSGMPEPLSPWPHSVLPPWPTRAFEAPRPRPAATLAHVDPATKPEALASKTEPAHASDEVSESG